MKRILSVFVMLTCTAVLSGCGGESPAEKTAHDAKDDKVQADMMKSMQGMADHAMKPADGNKDAGGQADGAKDGEDGKADDAAADGGKDEKEKDSEE